MISAGRLKSPFCVAPPAFLQILAPTNEGAQTKLERQKRFANGICPPRPEGETWRSFGDPGVTCGEHDGPVCKHTWRASVGPRPIETIYAELD